MFPGFLIKLRLKLVAAQAQMTRGFVFRNSVYRSVDNIVSMKLDQLANPHSDTFCDLAPHSH